MRDISSEINVPDYQSQMIYYKNMGSSAVPYVTFPAERQPSAEKLVTQNEN